MKHSMTIQGGPLRRRRRAEQLLMAVGVAAAVIAFVASAPTGSSGWDMAYAQFDTPTPPTTPTSPPTATFTPPPAATPTWTPIPPATPTFTPGPTETPFVPSTPTPGETPVASPTRPSAATPKPAVERGPVGTPSNAAVGRYVYVVKPQGIALGVAPGFDMAHVQMALAGDQLCVIDGPVYVDTLWWWKFRTANGAEGWGISDGVALAGGQCLVAVSALTSTPAARRTGALPNTGADLILLWAGVASVCLLLLVGLVRRRSMPAE